MKSADVSTYKTNVACRILYVHFRSSHTKYHKLCRVKLFFLRPYQVTYFVTYRRTDRHTVFVERSGLGKYENVKSDFVKSRICTEL